MLKIAYNGLSILNIIHISKLVVFGLIISLSVSRNCMADDLIKPHNPTKEEHGIIDNISNTNRTIKFLIQNKIDDEHPMPTSHVLFAKVNLGTSKSSIVALLIEYTHGIGQAGFPLFLFQDMNGRWMEIGYHDMMDDEYFIVKSQVVNGYKVIQFPREKRDNIFNGKSYECPTCPPSD